MKLKDLLEVRIHPNDPAMADLWQRGVGASTPQREGPYAVGWSAQSFEWYGDEGPESGEGRYKPKGDGGEIVAINIPTYDTAQQVANKLDKDYEAKQFYDKSVYGKHGKDWYINDYHGSWIKPMSRLDDYERETLSSRVKDFSKQ
jgi:hypothetical protein